MIINNNHKSAVEVDLGLTLGLLDLDRVSFDVFDLHHRIALHILLRIPVVALVDPF